MDYYELGRTGIRVSALCYGTLPMGPLQADLPAEDGGRLILEGLQKGINFIDTAEIYRTYPHVKWALDRFTGETVIASKSTASDYQGMKASIEMALNELGKNKIDIFHLHAAREDEPLKKRAGAMEALREARQKGLIKAAGLANHSVKGVRSAAGEPELDVIFALINRTGLGILDGGPAEMMEAVGEAKAAGQGVYAMKALGGGNLLADVAENFRFVRLTAGIPIVAVGMLRSCEIEMNVALFEGSAVPENLQEQVRQYKKRAQVLFLCKGCGRCVELCHNGAVAVRDGKARIDPEKCLLCGYCSRGCPQFAIRVI
ncbi:MAG: aldo/keto reductase [Bacillota bacterium]